MKIYLKLLKLPINLQDLLFLQFLADCLCNISCINSNFRHVVKYLLLQKYKKIQQIFKEKFMPCFQLLGSESKISALKLKKKAYYHEKLLTFKIVKDLSQSVCVSISYRIYSKKKQNWITKHVYYFLDYNKGQRNVWLAKENARNFFIGKGIKNVALVQQILAARKQDIISLSFPFLNEQGSPDISSIQVCIKPAALKQRTCYLEKRVLDWTLFEYSSILINLDIQDIQDGFSDLFALKETRCAGNPQASLFYKLIFIAKKAGLVKNSLRTLGHKIQVFDQKEPIKVRLKQEHQWQQPQSQIQLRLGDVVTVYINASQNEQQ